RGLSSAPPIPAGIRSFWWNSGGFRWNGIWQGGLLILSFRCCLIPVEFDHSGIYTGMVPGMAFPGMGRNGIPVEFRSNSVCLFSLFICTNEVYLATKHGHSPLPTHHQPCSSPPPPFVTAH
ncbi:hypothetical protein K443DRAFT_643488, partial [Laccaria amethystina LaAM-08-1]